MCMYVCMEMCKLKIKMQAMNYATSKATIDFIEMNKKVTFPLGCLAG